MKTTEVTLTPLLRSTQLVTIIQPTVNSRSELSSQEDKACGPLSGCLAPTLDKSDGPNVEKSTSWNTLAEKVIRFTLQLMLLDPIELQPTEEVASVMDSTLTLPTGNQIELNSSLMAKTISPLGKVRLVDIGHLPTISS